MFFKARVRSAGPLILALILWAGGLRSAQAQDVIKESFNVDQGGTLHLDMDYGSVEIRSHSSASVLITLERDVDGVSSSEMKEILALHEFRFEQDGDDVIVELDYENDGNDSAWRRWKNTHELEIDLVITVPDEYNVSFRTGAGNVDIADLDGWVDGRTGAGNVDIGRIYGEVDVSSGAGNVRIRGARGEVYVQSGAGDIILEDVDGVITARTGAGNVEAYISRELRGDSSFSTGAGNVTVYLEEDIGADVEARASLGNARSDYNLRESGKWMSKSLSGRVNGGGPEISMSAGVGNVSLRRN